MRPVTVPLTGCVRSTRNSRTCCGSRGLAEVHTASPARRMVQSCAWSSLLDLEAVSKRVERVEPAHAGHFVIRASSRTSPVHLDDALTAIRTPGISLSVRRLVPHRSTSMTPSPRSSWSSPTRRLPSSRHPTSPTRYLAC